jgi:hypothetical protein
MWRFGPPPRKRFRARTRSSERARSKLFFRKLPLESLSKSGVPSATVPVAYLPNSSSVSTRKLPSWLVTTTFPATGL